MSKKNMNNKKQETPATSKQGANEEREKSVIKDIVTNDTQRKGVDKLLAFMYTNKAYIGAVAILLILVVIFARFSGPKVNDGMDTEQTEMTEIANENDSSDKSNTEKKAENFVLDKEFKQDSIKELNALIERYFEAYATDDLEMLDKTARPMSDNEKSYIGIFSQYIDGYKNIKCYSKSGLTEGAYLVSVYYELKFVGVDTLAPGMEFFYVETDENKELFINNVYSSYNMTRREHELDEDIYTVIQTFEQQGDVTKMLSEVEKKYNEAVSGDVNLAKMISSTIPSAMSDWLNSINEEKPDTQVDTEQSTEETTEQETQKPEEQPEQETQKPEEQPEQETQKPEEQPEQETQKPEEQPEESTTKRIAIETTDNVFVRGSASPDGEVYERAKLGKSFVKVGEQDGWTKIEYKGGYAYIKSEYVKIRKNTSQSAYIETTANVFVRGSASPDGEVYERAKLGKNFVKVGTEGDWTKIEYKGGYAYIKSEYVKVVE